MWGYVVFHFQTTTNQQEFCFTYWPKGSLPSIPIPPPLTLILNEKKYTKTVHTKQCKHYIMGSVMLTAPTLFGRPNGRPNDY
jgi:hypothetical protein